jgi:hypothetical protein
MKRPLEAMKTIYNTNGYTELHGAVGYLDWKKN